MPGLFKDKQQAEEYLKTTGKYIYKVRQGDIMGDNMPVGRRVFKVVNTCQKVPEN